MSNKFIVSEEEFRKKAKEVDWTDEEIEEEIRECKERGIPLALDVLCKIEVIED